MLKIRPALSIKRVHHTLHMHNSTRSVRFRIGYAAGCAAWLCLAIRVYML